MHILVIFLTHIKLDLIHDMYSLGGAVISWKQTLVATSSNHSEILALYEVGRECVWLWSMIQHIRATCVLSSIKDFLTLLYENNAACITQVKNSYIKGIESSIFHQKISARMSFRRLVTSKFNKFSPITILQICSLKHCQLQHLERLPITLEYVNSKIFLPESERACHQ